MPPNIGAIGVIDCATQPALPMTPIPLWPVSMTGGGEAYAPGADNLSFAGADIRTVEVPDIGTIVSVTLAITVDVGSTTFSVFIPDVIVSAPNGSTPVRTEGITTIHRMPFGPPSPGQREVYSVVRLTGTANHQVF